MPNFIKFYVKLQRQTSTYCKRSRQRQVKRHTMTFRSLTKLTSKDVEWQWGPEQQNAFQLLKDCLSSPPILCYPDFYYPYGRIRLRCRICPRADAGRKRQRERGCYIVYLSALEWNSNKLEHYRKRSVRYSSFRKSLLFLFVRKKVSSAHGSSATTMVDEY